MHISYEFSFEKYFLREKKFLFFKTCSQAIDFANHLERNNCESMLQRLCDDQQVGAACG